MSYDTGAEIVSLGDDIAGIVQDRLKITLTPSVCWAAACAARSAQPTLDRFPDLAAQIGDMRELSRQLQDAEVTLSRLRSRTQRLWPSSPAIADYERDLELLRQIRKRHDTGSPRVKPRRPWLAAALLLRKMLEQEAQRQGRMAKNLSIPACIAQILALVDVTGQNGKAISTEAVKKALADVPREFVQG
jgi:hypothetical protein